MTEKRVVYVAMSADLIHPGHVNILKIARKTADKIGARVVVGLLTDAAIASYKRLPYMNYAQRKAVLESISFIDEVIPQDTLSYEGNIRLLKPAFVIHGDDWQTGAQTKTRQNVIEYLKRIGLWRAFGARLYRRHFIHAIKCERKGDWHQHQRALNLVSALACRQKAAAFDGDAFRLVGVDCGKGFCDEGRCACGI